MIEKFIAFVPVIWLTYLTISVCSMGQWKGLYFLTMELILDQAQLYLVGFHSVSFFAFFSFFFNLVLICVSRE